MIDERSQSLLKKAQWLSDAKKIALFTENRVSSYGLLASAHTFSEDEALIDLARLILKSCNDEDRGLATFEVIHFLNFMQEDSSIMGVIDCWKMGARTLRVCVNLFADDEMKMEVHKKMMKSMVATGECGFVPCIRLGDLKQYITYFADMDVEYGRDLTVLTDLLPYLRLATNEVAYDLLYSVSEKSAKNAHEAIATTTFYDLEATDL